MDVLVSDETKKAIEKRMDDKIVRQMFRELIDMGVEPREEISKWEFMRACNARFQALGGTGARTIGEVAEALVELAYERDEAMRIDNSIGGER